MGYKGKNIAIIGKNRYEWILSYVSVINGVGTVVPLDKGLPEDEIEMSIKRAKAEVIFCEESYLGTIKNIVDKKETNLKEIICMDEVQENLTVNKLIENGQKLIDQGNKEYISNFKTGSLTY